MGSGLALIFDSTRNASELAIGIRGFRRLAQMKRQRPPGHLNLPGNLKVSRMKGFLGDTPKISFDLIPFIWICDGMKSCATGAGQIERIWSTSLAEPVSACNARGWPKVQRFDDLR